MPNTPRRVHDAVELDQLDNLLARLAMKGQAQQRLPDLHHGSGRQVVNIVAIDHDVFTQIARAAPRLLGCSSTELDWTGLSRTSLSPQARAAKPRRLKAIAPCRPENRTGIGPHSQRGKPSDLSPGNRLSSKPGQVLVRTPNAESPVISVPEISYSEKPGQVLVRTSRHEEPGDFSP